MESLPHAGDWLLFEKNIGAYVGIDEVCLSRGELYTILINKEKTGRSGSIIAIVKRYRWASVTSVLSVSRRRRFQVREITMDMAPNMEQIARVCFPAARRVTDRFHVQKLALKLRLVLEAGLEPAQPQWPRDFKSLVSTIPPFEHPKKRRESGKRDSNSRP